MEKKMVETAREELQSIKLDETDNVAVIVNEKGGCEGQSLSDGTILRENVPQCHKVALEDIATGSPIRRYGKIIGYALQDILRGGWVNEFMIALPNAPELKVNSAASEVQMVMPLSRAYTFQGYRNPDGTAGIRNILGILPSVQCVVGVLQQAVKILRQDILKEYSYVDDVVVLNHNYGCGVAIQAPEAKIPIQTLKNLAVHPNLGGELLIVGLGCEKLQPNCLIPDGTNPEIIVLQEKNGYAAMLDDIIKSAKKCLDRLNKRRREKISVSELTIGLQCGGSDAFSGITANPAIGYAADLLVRSGATVMFSEVTEVRDGIQLLLQRAATAEVEKKLIVEMQWYDHYLTLGQVDRSANPAPGNKKGGLTNIVEKAMGSIAKSGTMPIVGVLSPGEKPNRKGLIYAATPASDFVCGTLQLAAGMHLQVFSTGRGTTYGLAMAPVVKVSTRNELKDKWRDLIDINAGPIATGEASIKEIGEEIFHFILSIASGEKETWAQHWNLHNDLCLFNPAPVT